MIEGASLSSQLYGDLRLEGRHNTSPQTVFPGLAYGDKTPRIEDPTKEPSELYSYEFTGWSPEIADTVTGDITYMSGVYAHRTGIYRNLLSGRDSLR